LRKARGVWYTPAPVVNFIVRAVDDILKTEFDLPQGLADTSKTKIKVDLQGKKVEQEVHKVQILDPATGTGTFLAETIKHIHKKFEGQQGIWSNYVETHLLPRLNGFELLMASYAMAHLQLDLLLTETGFKPTTNQRLRVYLTNSLEESHPDTGTLFANWLSSEANEANHIKRDSPVMCVIGNPPYSGESANNGKWIMNLMEDYKKEPGGNEKLKERNPKWINDDYVKFLRYGQHFIEKNGSGVLAFINPHGFLDNPTFRGMRWNLLKTYDKIYTIDLHGNSNKQEKSPDGSVDVNVFDIQQGVSINLFIKTGKKKVNELGKVFHFDLYGKREMKYDFLTENTLKDIVFNQLEISKPNYFFVSRNIKKQNIYEKGISVSELFTLNSIGIVTSKDEILINSSKEELIKNVSEYYSINADINLIKKISYRPFDGKFIYYDVKIIERARYKVMKHFLEGNNFGLVTARSNKSNTCDHFYISNNLMETKCGERTTQSAIFPLYLYPDNKGQQTIDQTTERTPNLNPEIVKQIAEQLGLTFVPDHELCHAELVSASQQTLKRVQGDKTVFTPLDILDYIYAVLHSPTYREKYKEFLKIDFPRVPYPKDAATFWQLVKLGGQIRQIHLLESSIVEKYITGYPEDGDNVVVKPRYEINPVRVQNSDRVVGKVYINDTQYFSNVPEVAWNFYIGGYQPAQKWLKDRKDRKLEFDDILHYQKIIVALSETDRLMKEIDAIGIE
jgi:predicted helicase